MIFFKQSRNLSILSMLREEFAEEDIETDGVVFVEEILRVV